MRGPTGWDFNPTTNRLEIRFKSTLIAYVNASGMFLADDTPVGGGGSIPDPLELGAAVFDELTVAGARVYPIGIQYVDVQLNDAQIKALPHGAELIEAPGDGLAIHVISAWIVAELTAEYSGGDPPQLAFGWSTGVGSKARSSAYIDWSDTLLTDTVGSPPETRLVNVLPVVLQPDANGGSNVGTSRYEASIANAPLILFDDDNWGGSDYDGGDAVNTLSLRIWYSIVPTVPFGGA